MYAICFWVSIPRSPTNTSRWRPKRSRSFVNLGGDGGRIAGVALEYLDGHRTAVGISQQAEVDLQVSRPLIPALAKLRQGTLAAFKVGGGQIIEHE